MTISIKIPKGDSVKTGLGTKFFTESGHEITDVKKCVIEINPDKIVTAVITCELNPCNLDGIALEMKNMELIFIEDEVKKHGYKLVRDDG